MDRCVIDCNLESALPAASSPTDDPASPYLDETTPPQALAPPLGISHGCKTHLGEATGSELKISNKL